MAVALLECIVEYFYRAGSTSERTMKFSAGVRAFDEVVGRLHYERVVRPLLAGRRGRRPKFARCG